MKRKKEYRKGERVFNLAYPFILLIYYPLLLLPKNFCKFLFGLTRWIPGKIGLGIRYAFVKRLAKKCGKNIAIFPTAYIHFGNNLILGSHISIWEFCFIDGDSLEVGDNVMFAHGSSVITGTHLYNTDKPFRDTLIQKHVKIGNNVWIGAGARILAGVEIGDNVIIGANAVVTKSIPSNSIAVGIPARIIKRIEKKNENIGK